MRLCLLGLLAPLGLVFACGGKPQTVVVVAPPPAPVTARLPVEPPPLGKLARDVRPTREQLELTIDPTADVFHGVARIEITVARPRDVIWLHGKDLRVDIATVVLPNGTRVRAEYAELDPSGVASLTLPAPVSGAVTLELTYDAAYDKQLVGVYRVKDAVYSKFEAIYARRAFPCFDEPSFKIPFQLALIVPGAAVALSNTPILDEKALTPTTKRVTFEPTPPLPTYLVAFAVGKLESKSTEAPPTELRPTALPISVVALAGRMADMAYALAEEPTLIAEQERYFGIAFPFPKLDLVAVPDFQSGAMENAGAITFRDDALLVDDQHAAVSQKIRVTSVIAHETAHQWFGDLVTMKWWDDLWLNEGFATFLATKTLLAVRPTFDAELDAVNRTDRVMNQDSLASARRVRQAIETTHDITNAFDGITYTKGAAFLAMLEHYLGEAQFRAAIHDYLTAHAGGNATTDDLVHAWSAAAGRDLSPLAASFLDQPGVPVIAVHARCTGGKGAALLAQSRWHAVGAQQPGDPLWQVPVCLRIGAHGASSEVCTLLTERTATVELPTCADWIMPNANATGYYRFTEGAAELAQLRDHSTSALTVAERLALAHDLDAGFRSAALPAADVLRALETLARDPHGTVAAAPIATFRMVDDDLIASDAARTRYHVRLARLYAPAIAALGWHAAPNDPPWRRAFRADSISFVALALGDRVVLADAARIGRAVLGLGPHGDHAFHPDAADPDLERVVLGAAARTGGAEVVDALIAELAASDDAVVRGHMLSALAAVRDPAQLDRALALALDPRLRHNERVMVLAPLLADRDTRDRAWAWLVAHFDELAPLLPDRFAGQLPGVLLACDAGRIAKLRALFEPRVGALTGGPRNLALAIESAEQCVARVAAQQASVDAFLAH